MSFTLISAIFLSTPSARRATARRQVSQHLTTISIHALREEGDYSCGIARQYLINFYPRPPRGGRRRSSSQNAGNCAISIHALREEGDGEAAKDATKKAGISIHALREEGDDAYQGVHSP